MKNIVPNFDEFINESIRFNDNMGRPSKISKEILAMVEKAFPANVLKAIVEVEPNGYSEYVTPPTIGNKGQSRGATSYKTIMLVFDKSFKDVRYISVALKKRTSGPGTGYLAFSGQNTKGHYLLDDKAKDMYSVAIEFYTDPEEKLEELFNKELKKYFK